MKAPQVQSCSISGYFKHKCFVLQDCIASSLVYKRGKLSRLRSSNSSSCLILLLNQMSLRRSRSNAGSSCGTKHPEALAGYFRDVIPEGVQVAAHTGLTGEERKGERRSPLGSITWTPVSLLLIPLILDSGVTLGLRCAV